MDFWFLTAQDNKNKVNPALTMRYKKTRAIMSLVLPSKSSQSEYGWKTALAQLKEWGLDQAEIILKSDQEQAVTAIGDPMVKNRKPALTTPERSPVGESESNGHIENAIWMAESQFRTLKGYTESKLKTVIQTTHPVVSWLVRRSSWLQTRYAVGRDGFAPYQRQRHKKYRGDLYTIGEKVHWRPPKANKRGKAQSRWGDGYFLGRIDRSNEYLIGTEKGVETALALRGLPEDEKWDADGLMKVRGQPWDFRPEDPVVVPAAAPIPQQIPPVREGRENVDDEVEPREAAERRTCLTKEVVKRFGATKGCPGCREVGKHHTPACRDRLEECWRKEEDEKKASLQKQIDELKTQVEAQRAANREAGITPEDEDPIPEEQEAVAMEGELEKLATVKEPPRQQKQKKRDTPEDTEFEDEAARKYRQVEVEEDDGMMWGPHSGSSSSTSAAPRVSQEEQREKRKAPEIGSWIQASDERVKKSRETSAILYLEEGRAPTVRFGNVELKMEDGCDKGEVQQILSPLEVYAEVTGALLDPQKVELALGGEMEEVRKHKVYGKIAREDALVLASKLGKKIVKVRWTDLNQGDEDNPRYRSRLVCCELKKGVENLGLYAATSPLFLLKAFLSMCATDVHKSGSFKKLLFLGVRRAFFWAVATGWAFIELVGEDKTESKDEVGVMEPGKGRSMYGSISAARNWQRTIKEVFVEKLGFTPGLSSPCLFVHKERGVLMMVHGDDFILLADDASLEWSEVELRKHWELKRKAKLGWEDDDDK